VEYAGLTARLRDLKLQEDLREGRADLSVALWRPDNRCDADRREDSRIQQSLVRASH
jgi:hypothetical protein